MNRVFAEFDSGRPGPLVIIIAGLHGNEQVGFKVTERFLSKLNQDDMVGKLAVVVGNLDAAKTGQRFIDHDLNRFFLTEYLHQPHADIYEWSQAIELNDAIEQLINSSPSATALHMLDMHSMSGAGLPFTCFPNTKENDRLARLLHLPAIAGLVEFLPGTLAEYFCHRFDTTLVAECGQHDAQETVENGLAILVHYLHLVGMMNVATWHHDAQQHLMHCTDGLWDVFTRVQYRYHIEKRAEFLMQPGYKNLQKISNETLLARDGQQLIYAPFDARIVLPCYQVQGDDGFFLAKDE